MAKSYWLVKQEPSTYSFNQLVREKRACWDGVRNFQARNNLAKMRVGDRALFYHSGDAREVVGIAEVAREAYPDPTAKEARWVAVDLVAVRPLKKPVTLEQIKSTPALRTIALVRQSRLSVMPLVAAEFEAIVKLGS
jgi:predicted RNA-binding protein with PUA-like domain